jgi:hypothetical protein
MQGLHVSYIEKQKPHSAACGFAQRKKAARGSCGFCTTSLITPPVCTSDPIYFIETEKMIQYSIQMYLAIMQVPKALVRRDCPNLGMGK